MLKPKTLLTIASNKVYSLTRMDIWEKVLDLNLARQLQKPFIFGTDCDSDLQYVRSFLRDIHISFPNCMSLDREHHIPHA